MSVRLPPMKLHGVRIGPREEKIIADVETGQTCSSQELARYQWLGDMLKRIAEWKRTKGHPHDQ